MLWVPVRILLTPCWFYKIQNKWKDFSIIDVCAILKINSLKISLKAKLNPICVCSCFVCTTLYSCTVYLSSLLCSGEVGLHLSLRKFTPNPECHNREDACVFSILRDGGYVKPSFCLEGSLVLSREVPSGRWVHFWLCTLYNFALTES